MSCNYESGYSSDESPKSPSNIIIRKDERRFSRNYEIVDLLKISKRCYLRGSSHSIKYSSYYKTNSKNYSYRIYKCKGTRCAKVVYNLDWTIFCHRFRTNGDGNLICFFRASYLKKYI